MATKSVSFKQRIIARATIDVKTSCGVIPALILKASYMLLVEQTMHVKSLQHCMYVASMPLQGNKRQKNKTLTL